MFSASQIGPNAISLSLSHFSVGQAYPLRRVFTLVNVSILHNHICSYLMQKVNDTTTTIRKCIDCYSAKVEKVCKFKIEVQFSGRGKDKI